METTTQNSTSAAATLVSCGSDFSFGSAKGFADESKSNLSISFEVENTTGSPIKVGMLPGLSMFKTIGDLETAIGAADHLADGMAGDLVLTMQTADRNLDHLFNYSGFTPLRMTKWGLASYTATGDPEATNFSNTVKSFWFTPFHKIAEWELPLRKFQSATSKQVNLLEVDFIAEGFPSIISPEHAMHFTINGNTKLLFTISFGAHDSRSQRFYRALKAADKILSPLWKLIAGGSQPCGYSH